MHERAYFEKREKEGLAPYAMLSSASRGREHAEPEHRFRMAFQRDRDRIIHSSGFRRLEYKTQVFVNHEGDYYRTRLTHTMETAQITRTIARAMLLNVDLAETIALAHDMGHTPFGHAGEEVLSLLMQEHGGFDHNSQSLRIVEVLERRYPNFPGLNLTFEVREGIVKHSAPQGRGRLAAFDPELEPPLEAQLVDLCDEIAYNSHDIDDGLQSGMLHAEDLDGVELWQQSFVAVKGRNPAADFSVLRYQTVRAMIDRLVIDLIENTEARLKELGITTVDDIRAVAGPVAGFSPQIAGQVAALKERLMERLYRHHRVRRMAAKAKRVMTGIFRAYIEDPAQMPPHIAGRAQIDPAARVVADYIAGMTDRFALEEYAKLYDPLERV